MSTINRDVFLDEQWIRREVLRASYYVPYSISHLHLPGTSFGTAHLRAASTELLFYFKVGNKAVRTQGCEL